MRHAVQCGIPAGRLARHEEERWPAGPGRHLDSHVFRPPSQQHPDPQPPFNAAHHHHLYSTLLSSARLALWDSPSPRLASDDQRRSPPPPAARCQTPRSPPSTIVPNLPAVPTQRAHGRGEMDGAADAALGAWASVRGFFTPATLFLVVNLVIGTIALTSRSRRRGGNNAHDDEPDRQRPQEPPFHQAHVQQQHEDQYYDDQQDQYVPPPPEPAPLARTSSVMDRLRSIGLYRFRSGDFPPEYATPVGTDSRDATSAPAPPPAPPAGDALQYARSRSDPAPAPRAAAIRRPAPSRMNKSSISESRTAELPPARAAQVVRSSMLEEEEEDGFVEYVPPLRPARQPQQQEPPPPLASQHEEEEDSESEEEEEEHYYREEYVPPVRPAPLARAPSVLERLRSFGLSRFHGGDHAADDAAAAVAELERNHAQKQQQFSRSRSEPSREQSGKGKKQQQQESAEARMSKSGSVARRPAPPAREAPAEVEGGVDARADDFINTFRKQLQLQRLNSLLNYKEMLNRGA